MNELRSLKSSKKRGIYLENKHQAKQCVPEYQQERRGKSDKLAMCGNCSGFCEMDVRA